MPATPAKIVENPGPFLQTPQPKGRGGRVKRRNKGGKPPCFDPPKQTGVGLRPPPYEPLTPRWRGAVQ